jgi:hypothetical protein
MEPITPKELERRKRLSKIMQSRWSDPAYRERLIKKQIALGYRLSNTKKNDKDNQRTSDGLAGRAEQKN